MDKNTGEEKILKNEVTKLIADAMQNAGIGITMLRREDTATVLDDRRDKIKTSDRRLSADLVRMTNASLPKNHILGFGKPGPLLQSTGIPFLPIEMSASRLAEKSRHPEHPFTLKELRGMAGAIQHPLAVFRSATREGCKVVVTDRLHEGKNFIIVVETGKKQGKEKVNSIRTIHYRNSNIHIANWINNGLLEFADKRKMSEWFSKQRYNSADVEKRFRHAANIVKNFQNPRIFKQIQADNGIFFSNALHALQSVRQQKANAVKWLDILTKAGGIKTEEDRWTGLSAWLRQNAGKELTKEDIAAYLSGNMIHVSEELFINYEDPIPQMKHLQQEMDEYIAEGEEVTGSIYYSDWYRYAYYKMVDKYGEDFFDAFDEEHGVLFIKDRELNSAQKILGVRSINELRLDNTSFGLENKKEIALYVPDIEGWNLDDEVHFGDVGKGTCIGWVRFGDTQQSVTYQQDEWEEMQRQMPKAEEWIVKECDNNYIPKLWYPPVKNDIYPDAHISFTHNQYRIWGVKGMLCNTHPTLEDAVRYYNRYVLPKQHTQRILVIDEIQSKRHQEGRKNGYVPVELTREYNRLQADNMKSMQSYYDKVREIRDDKGIKEAVEDDVLQQWHDVYPELGWLYQQWKRTGEDFKQFKDSHLEELRTWHTGKKVPDAPFEQSWHKLCMKRMLRYAAENGYDRLLWTTGETQAERYDIGLKVLHMYSEPYEAQSPDECNGYDLVLKTVAGNINLFATNEGVINDNREGPGSLQGKHLDKIFGPEVAREILESYMPLNFTGEELNTRLNNEGMKKFYDETLPNYMNRYGRQWGVQTGEVVLPLDGVDIPFHDIEVTDAMRRSVMQGQPMFMTGDKGKVYGYAVEDRVYLTPQGFNPETLVHEYTHVWALAMQRKNPCGWHEVRELLRDNPVWTEVVRDPYYQDIRNNDDWVAGETLARISGRVNSRYLMAKASQSGTEGLFSRVKAALHKFWGWVGRDLLGIKQFRSVTEVTDRVLYDLVRGTRLDISRPSEEKRRMTEDRISSISIYRGKYGLPYIKCKVDGEWQSGKPLTGSDRHLFQSEDLTQMAVRYFRKELEDTRTQNQGMKR